MYQILTETQIPSQINDKVISAIQQCSTLHGLYVFINLKDLDTYLKKSTMKTRKLYQAIWGIIFITFFSFGSCRKGGKCEQALNVNQSEIVVAFKDKNSGNYLYAEVNPSYNKDSIRVYDENNNNLVLLFALNQIPNTNSRYSDISFGNIYNPQTDANSFNSELCKNFIVKYKYNETDTIKACFKSMKTECGSVFETLKVFYKGMLVGSVSSKTGINVIINKE